MSQRPVCSKRDELSSRDTAIRTLAFACRAVVFHDRPAGGLVFPGDRLMLVPMKRDPFLQVQVQREFVAMIPAILRQLRYAYSQYRPEAREEAIQDALASTYVAYTRLMARDAAERVFPSALTRFAVAQFRAGRRVGNRQNARDVLSPCACGSKWFVERLDHFDPGEDRWMDAVVEDPQTPVFDQVCFRIDFPAWLNRLSPRDRSIAEMLALGHSTREVSRRSGLSAGRISQLRREFHESWESFYNN